MKIPGNVLVMSAMSGNVGHCEVMSCNVRNVGNVRVATLYLKSRDIITDV